MEGAFPANRVSFGNGLKHHAAVASVRVNEQFRQSYSRLNHALVSLCKSIDVESGSQDLAWHLLMQRAVCLFNPKSRAHPSAQHPTGYSMFFYKTILLQNNLLTSYRIAA